MTSPTARTLDYYRKQGRLVGLTEHYNAFDRRRHDLFGFVDCLVLSPGEIGVWAVQCTSASNHAARVAKILAEPRARTWLACGQRIIVVSWRKAKPRGKRAVWTPRIQSIELEDLPAASCGSA